MSEEKQFVLVLNETEVARCINGLTLWAQDTDYDHSGEVVKGYRSTIKTLESQVKHQRDMEAKTCQESTT